MKIKNLGAFFIFCSLAMFPWACGRGSDIQDSFFGTTTVSTNEMNATWTPKWNNIVGYWKMNDALGAGSVKDSSQVGNNNGTPTNITFGSVGKIGSAGTFTAGSLSRFYTPTINLGNNFTVMAWVYISASTGDIQSVIGNGQDSVADGFKLYINSYTTNNGKIYLETGNGTLGLSATTATGAFTAGQWHHLASVVDRTGGTATIYMNGVDITTASPIRTDFSTNLPLYVGTFATTYHYPLAGRVDEVAVWNTGLTAAEVLQIYNRQK